VALLCISLNDFGHGIAITCVGFVAPTVFALGSIITFRLKRNCILIVLFLLFSIGIFGLGQFYTDPTGNTFESIITNMSIVNQNKYPICDYQYQGVTLPDLLFFAKLSYTADEVYTQSFDVWFNSSEWTGFHVPSAPIVQFYDFTTYKNGSRITVIAIRGSYTQLDWVVDINLFQASLLLQLGGFIAPLINFWPASLYADVIALLSLQDKVQGIVPTYYQAVEDYIVSYNLTNNTVLVGHSLGGAVAAIVGSRLNMPALTFSSPGILRSYLKFGIADPDTIRKNVVNIRPTNDIIPKIDELTGSIHDIRCDDALTLCHKLRKTGCELLTSCGDPLNRAFRYCIDPNY